MTDVSELLTAELTGATTQASEAGDDPARVLAALDRFAALIVALDNTRLDASAQTKELIKEALKLGVDPRDLYGRPFSNTIVLRQAKEAGVDVEKRGPRPRRMPHRA
jgi:hypothetical protein